MADESPPPPSGPWWKTSSWSPLSWSASSWSASSWPMLTWDYWSAPSATRASDPVDPAPAGWWWADLGQTGLWSFADWRFAREPVIEAAEDADLPDLADIHAASFSQTWSEDEIAALMGGAGVFCLVARRGTPYGTRRPIGFIMMRSVAGEAEVLTIAVHPHHRGAGIGGLLTDAALRRLYVDGVACVFLEVDTQNAPALAVYRRRGFVQVGQRPGYYAHAAGQGHALVLRCDLR